MKDEIIRKQEELIEASEIIQNLKAYSMIHPVTAVIYADGTHEEFIKRADEWLNRFRQSQLAELKEQDSEPVSKSYKLKSENMDKINKMANQDELLADMELEQSAEKCYYFIERIRDNAWLTGLFTWTHDPNEAWKTTDKIVLENIVDRMFRNRCVVTEHLFIKQPKDEPKEQSAEEILDKVIELNNPKPFTKFQRYITLKAMQKYRQQGIPSEEEISRKLDALNFKTSKEREDAYDAIDYVINKWKGE